MTWEQFCAARQVLAEEQVGIAQRFLQRLEQQQVEQTKTNIRRHQGLNADATQGMGRMPNAGNRGVE